MRYRKKNNCYRLSGRCHCDIFSDLFQRNRSGFTLIEITVVILVAAIILPALILPFVEGVQRLNLPMVLTTLSFLAQEEMEKNIICLDYDAIAEWTDSPLDGFPGYTSTCIFDDTVDFGEVVDGVRLITVIVTYNDPELDPNPSLSLVTVKTDWAPE